MRISKKALAAAPVAAALAAAGYVAARLGMSRPRTSGGLRLDCLDSGVEVHFDGAGIPHIRAESTHDAFRALGYVMAQDRIVQMETMLRVAKGRLAEAIGGMGLEMDRFMRTIGIERASASLYAKLDADSRDTLEAFCQGINAYLALPGIRMPVEFLILGRPGVWRPEDCLVSGLFFQWLLDASWPADLTREKLVRSLGRERAMELLPETAPYNNPPFKVDGPGLKVEPNEPGEEIDWGIDGEGGGGQWLPAPGITRGGMGSNNWVISGERTTTGKPIMCCDPHVQHNAPGVVYMCHVTSPDMDIIGASIPGLPVVAYGHNGFCSWGATALCPDVQDLYVETFESEDSDRYLYRGEWLDAEVVEEEVKVRFSRTRRLKVTTTRHGPIISRKGNKGLALRWVSYDTELDSLEAILKQNRASSWDEFLSAMENFVGPAMNQVYADKDGNIGYIAAAKVPLRSSGDGTMPYDGSRGEGEWEGYIPFERMPHVLNPEEGFIATANSKIVSEGYPELITRGWEAPYRNGRISYLLRSRQKHSPDDMAAIHGDAFTFPGKRFAELAAASVRGAEKDISEGVRRAAESLGEWDFQARAGSVAMTLYFYSWNLMREKLLRHRLGSTLYDEYVRGWTTVSLALENILERRDPYWLPPGIDSYEALALESLEEGVRELESVFAGEDVSTWRWGRVHYLTCQHLLGLFWPLDRIFNVGPVPRDGEGDTVNAAPPASDSLVQLLGRGTMGGCGDVPILPDCSSHAAYGGPVLRMVVDFADLDNSRAVLDVGQSGHRLSPHYKDHFPRWLAVEYLPLPYSPGKVDELTESTLTLRP